MSKRGISPLIAVVLLVGVAVVLAAFLLYFLQDLTEEQTDKAGDKLILNQVCMEDVDIDYKRFCFSDGLGAGNEYVNITIQNRAQIPIESFAFNLVGTEIRVGMSTAEDQLAEYVLAPYGTTTYNVSVSDQDITDPNDPETPGELKDDEIRNIEILVKKTIDYQDVSGQCDEDELNINVIYHCARSELF